MSRFEVETVTYDKTGSDSKKHTHYPDILANDLILILVMMFDSICDGKRRFYSVSPCQCWIKMQSDDRTCDVKRWFPSHFVYVG